MKNYVFENGFRVALNPEKGRLEEIARGGRKLNFGRVPFYSVKLRDREGKASIVSAGKGFFRSFHAGEAVYSHPEFDVKLSLSPQENTLHWRMEIKNKTDSLIEWVELMSFGVFGKLKDEPGGRGEILFPYNEGCLVTDMGRRNASPFPYIEPEYPSLGKYAVFPNMICSQFLAYLSQGDGIYLGMHDGARTTKHIDFRPEGDCIKLQLRAFADVDFGQDYQMPFDCVMTFFEGDWRDACGIYRAWFEKNLPAGLTKISMNASLPAWYAQSPIVVTYPIRGKFDTDEMTPNGLYPYKNALPYLRELSRKTDSKVMALLMHWEGTAPWAPPYVWPPYGGTEEFTEFTEELHLQNMLLGVYCSGLGWTQQSNLIPEYNKEAEFEKEHLNEIMCSDPAGELRSEICTAQRKGYDLCPACGKTKEIVSGEIVKIAESGVDYIQAFDQNHGGNSYFCYSDRHGHIPAPGKWQQEEVNALIRKIFEKTESRGKGGKVLLGCESAAAEPFLANLKFSDNRFELNYYIGLPVPVYAYLYHEYVNNFMGNQICMTLSEEPYNYAYRVAYSFVAGDMLTAVLTDRGEISYAWGNDCFKARTDKESACTILKNLNAWRTGAGKEFLHCGRMTKPLAVSCGKNKFRCEDGREIEVDEVLTAAYEYSGKTVQFLANYNDKPVTVQTEAPVCVYDAKGNKVQSGVRETEIPALSAVMVASETQRAQSGADCAGRKSAE